MKSSFKQWTAVSVLFLVVVGLWFIYQYWIEHHFELMDDRAKHGDMFGGLNTLFAGLAFAGVIYTIYLQSKELALQREELKLTRDELNRTAKANEDVVKSMGLQIETQRLSAQLSAIPILLEQEYNHLENYHKKFLATGSSFHVPASMTNKHYELWINKYKDENKQLDDIELCFLNNMKDILRLRIQLININKKLESHLIEN